MVIKYLIVFRTEHVQNIKYGKVFRKTLNMLTWNKRKVVC